VTRAGRARAALLAALGLASADPAAAHTRSLSYSTIALDAGGADVSVRVARLDLTRLGFDPGASERDGRAAADYLSERLELSAGGTPCALAGAPVARPAPEGWLVYAWRLACRSSGRRALASAILREVAPSHLHFARAAFPDGSVLERVLSEAEPRWELPPPVPAGPAEGSAQGTSLAGYLALGIEHILTGFDHLAFLVALLLLAASLRELAALVTAFTLAHSATLGLATLGLVHPRPPAVEALIGFSIALVAAENAWILGGRDRWVPRASAGALLLLALAGGGAVGRPALLGLALFTFCHFGLLRASERPARLRAAVAFAFGLVHGFGFAGILGELALPRARLVPALFGFNAGVEIGQLAVVAAVWPLLRGLERLERGRVGRLVAESGSAAVCALGLYWFLTRTLGPTG
jgi:hypothetical protein